MEAGQRTLILEAMADVMAERRANAGTVGAAEVIARAGVTPEEFDELFADREACLLAAFDLGVERAGAGMVAAFGAESGWLDSIKAGLASFLRFLDSEPALGRLCVVFAMGGGEAVLRRRLEVMRVLAAAVDRGGLAAPKDKQKPPAVIAEGVVGAVVSVLQNRLLADDESKLIELFGPLISIIVLPYLGAGVARRELTRPAPRAKTEQLSPGAGGERLGTRLTYRTARVLSAIADYPGASNREVAERAGVVDQGQISKLLARLEERSLIEKMGEGVTRGAPNSWRLTERGEEVLKSASVRPGTPRRADG